MAVLVGMTMVSSNWHVAVEAVFYRFAPVSDIVSGKRARCSFHACSTLASSCRTPLNQSSWPCLAEQ
eukprot:1687225-Alexandrium_andersonii.AAC.2